MLRRLPSKASRESEKRELSKRVKILFITNVLGLFKLLCCSRYFQSHAIMPKND
jgi:hypothetical protein